MFGAGRVHWEHLKNLQTMQMSKLSASILIIVIVFPFLGKNY